MESPEKRPKQQYRGLSQVASQPRASQHNQEFQERFKGRATLITKDGDQGVVLSAHKPILKDAPQ